ncbi:rod shape-determining protein RodA [Anaplasma marginale str. Dawn]|uniref:rod shape-determining protein RodA n=1 Tax=Anaplasma marginale TaxID=770 RepID=UPI0001B46387|nr:rod shape-determining protein RodA [Anaplasma marginale]AGZ78495.1 rod shape-determining protein RodA [Anaplasma marginale str. Gypsy Plains]AGZ79353.1 rod shape-determining protein RodA [Anaplasma marginale str. Dawn]AXW83694.1 rod shape-determining protein RodA [Anaplasma marginale]AXW84608.1 rod shape-determining protein RodA [Anaplasma marginale]KAA8472314.1 rod shape-determining protein RodA [Anaplasma marginale]
MSKIRVLLLLDVAILLLVGFGIQYSSAGGHWHPFAKHHLYVCAVCIPLSIAASFVSVKSYMRYSYLAYAGAFCLLLMVHVFGHSAMGATRWLKVGAFGAQPSEFAKVSLILALARYFHCRNPHRSLSLRNFTGGMIITLPLVLSVSKQPNLGTAGIMLLMAMLMMFVAVADRRYMAWFLSLLCAMSPIVWGMLHHYQKNRLLSFLDPGRDPMGMGYNSLQSQIAIGSGGMYGKGFANGSQTKLGFLPEKQTDFVFSVFSEEHGFVGVILLFALYSMLVYTSLYVALCARCNFSRLMAVGISVFFMLHLFINVGMVTGILPIVGIPLPFLSYGGSIMLTSMVLVGILAAVAREARTP